MAGDDRRPEAVVGAGSIGTGFALVFAGGAAGYPVRLDAVDPARLAAAGTTRAEPLAALGAASGGAGECRLGDPDLGRGG